MLWVTRGGVHLDRVATPWLIRRFVDVDARFVFIDPATEAAPPDAIPFSLPGAELAPATPDQSTFRAVLDTYELDAPALGHLASIVETGIAVARGTVSDELSRRFPEGAGLNAFSEGMLISGRPDADIVAASTALYDALFDYCRAKTLEPPLPPEISSSPARRFSALRERLAQ